MSKLILQVWLLGLFLHFFGLPALRRFHDKNVIVVKSVRKSDRTPVPAISIAVKGVENGWRKEGIFQHIAKEHCKSANSVEELIICIEKLTYDPDMKFVQNFTPPDFQVKNFTPSISPNFNSFSKKKHRK